MPYSVQCPQCGAMVRLPESNAGLMVLCLSCGQSFRARALTTADVEPSADEPLAELLDQGYLREPARLVPKPVPPPPRPIDWRMISIAAVSLVILSFLFGGAIYWAMRTPPAPPAPPPPTVAANSAPESPVGDSIFSSNGPSTPSPAQTAPSAAPATAQAPVGRPVPLPMPADPNELTDEHIGQAIQRGVDYLAGKFDPKTSQIHDDLSGGDEGYACGLDSLCVYALLQCSQAIVDKRLDIHGSFLPGLIDGMKRMPATRGKVTYARGIRATALALYNRPEDHYTLSQDVIYLVSSQVEGGYDYAAGPDGGLSSRWDNSNSQYGLLGVWAGAESGIAIKSDYWNVIQKHWAMDQQPNGMWGYRAHETGTASMTAAGTASLFVAEDYLYAERFAARVGREPFTEPLQRALGWWENAPELSIAETASGWWGYGLYGIERVGLASGFKFFGKRDWYRELSRQVLSRQAKDGSWNNLIDTSYALLFLSRGRHPILMNKLRFEHGGPDGELPGFWANRPRDAANLARFAGRQLERPLNWQIVPLEREWYDWLDSPILSIASHAAPYFTDAEVEKLRQYSEAGGLLYLHADGGSVPFDTFAKDLAKRLFPQYPLVDVSAAHPIYNVLYKIDPQPPMKAVSNGVRVLLLYSTSDISRFWQVRETPATANVFRFGTNLFVYTAGKRELRNRLASPYIAPPPIWPPPLGAFDVARVSYDGAWDPEPGAWRRFANLFAKQTSTGLSVHTVALKNLGADASPLAVMTGITAFKPGSDEIQSLRSYVQNGGVLFIDACGGSPLFVASMKSALHEAFAMEKLVAIDASSHPLLSAGAAGMSELHKPHLRPFAIEQRDAETGRAPRGELLQLESGEGVVIFSPFDITSGLLGTQTWGIFGYEPAYAESLTKNLVFWTMDRKR